MPPRPLGKARGPEITVLEPPGRPGGVAGKSAPPSFPGVASRPSVGKAAPPPLPSHLGKGAPPPPPGRKAPPGRPAGLVRGPARTIGGSSLAQCRAGHRLGVIRTDQLGYTCSLCRSIQPAGASMMACRPCNYDLCESCVAQTTLCPQRHELGDFLVQEAGWTCSSCSQAVPVGQAMGGCRACDFDLCEPCARGACPKCRGSGRVPWMLIGSKTCPTCSGSGMYFNSTGGGPAPDVPAQPGQQALPPPPATRWPVPKAPGLRPKAGVFHSVSHAVDVVSQLPADWAASVPSMHSWSERRSEIMKLQQLCEAHNTLRSGVEWTHVLEMLGNILRSDTHALVVASAAQALQAMVERMGSGFSNLSSTVMEPLLARLKESNSTIRTPVNATIDAIVKHAACDTVWTAILNALQDRLPSVRHGACGVMSRCLRDRGVAAGAALQHQAQALLTAVVSITEDPDKGARDSACEVLGYAAATMGIRSKMWGRQLLDNLPAARAELVKQHEQQAARSPSTLLSSPARGHSASVPPTEVVAQSVWDDLDTTDFRKKLPALQAITEAWERNATGLRPHAERIVQEVKQRTRQFKANAKPLKVALIEFLGKAPRLGHGVLGLDVSRSMLQGLIHFAGEVEMPSQLVEASLTLCEFLDPDAVIQALISEASLVSASNDAVATALHAVVTTFGRHCLDLLPICTYTSKLLAPPCQPALQLAVLLVRCDPGALQTLNLTEPGLSQIRLEALHQGPPPAPTRTPGRAGLKRSPGGLAGSPCKRLCEEGMLGARRRVSLRGPGMFSSPMRDTALTSSNMFNTPHRNGIKDPLQPGASSTLASSVSSNAAQKSDVSAFLRALEARPSAVATTREVCAAACALIRNGARGDAVAVEAAMLTARAVVGADAAGLPDSSVRDLLAAALPLVGDGQLAMELEAMVLWILQRANRRGLGWALCAISECEDRTLQCLEYLTEGANAGDAAELLDGLRPYLQLAEQSPIFGRIVEALRAKQGGSVWRPRLSGQFRASTPLYSPASDWKNTASRISMMR